MDEFELLEGVAEMFTEAEVSADSILMEGALVEENEAVAEVANAPAIAADAQLSTLQQIQAFISDNRYGQTMWKFAKSVAGAAVSASIAFAIMYGLNKAVAEKAHNSGNRMALSEYLVEVEANYKKIGITWNYDLLTQAATDALSYPWIDATK